MADMKLREERDAEWWAAWRKEDFSWDGLADKPWEGWTVTADGFAVQTDTGRRYGAPKQHGGAVKAEGRATTLQDYWRVVPATGRLRSDAEMGEELVRAENQPIYHRAHLPLTYEDGAQTGKASWPDYALDALANPRLMAAEETAWSGLTLDRRKVVGADGRAQFQGGVWLCGAFLSLGNGSPLSLRYEFAALVRHAQFDNATFSGHTCFDNAIFSGDAFFDSATFTGDAFFNGAVFSKDARFKHVAFSGDARFDSATFSGGSSFDGATFSENARFNGAAFSQAARFDSAIFSGRAYFNSATFSKLAVFYGAAFSGEALFFAATFEEETLFGNCLFGGLARFNFARFRGRMEFTASVFEKLATFEALSWPEDVRDWHSAFNQALFKSTLGMSGSGFRSFAAFDGATLERGVQIDDADERKADAAFWSERRAALDSTTLDGEVFRLRETEARMKKDKDAAKPVSRSEIAAHVREARETRLKQLERGCRVLKQSMEKASNKSREQLLYRYELQARRAQRNLPFGEKTFSYLYAAASDYGASMWRPFAALAFLIAVFAGVFFGWSLSLGQIGAGDTQIETVTAAWQALDLSWANVFKPLSALTSEASGEGTLGDRLLIDRPGIAFAVRAVATLQSLLAIVLAFLFALAVRRRFQIS
ncbi:MAG: hypothetical protein FD124_426 [Alphaproteobacteria bacterium]|nr:MAG: hypothetical protein FD160_2628 [Caulobacteraceae bacterium]TPW08366.1 MAG: hypothetical protein FD124_426 [Alphaproteobacteria bacterium]